MARTDMLALALGIVTMERFLTRAQEATWGAPLPLPTAADAPTLGAFPPPVPMGRAPAFGQALPQLNEAPPPGYFGRGP